MKWMSTALFEVLWKLITGSWILVAFRRGWGASSTDPPTREELAAEEASQRRSAAEVGASPTDRDLARALIRSSEMPPGLSESWRGWSPLDPSDPIVVSAQQSLASKQGRFRRRAPTQRILLELRRYWNEEAASEAMLGADGARNAGRQPNARTRQGRGRRDPNLRVESAGGLANGRKPSSNCACSEARLWRSCSPRATRQPRSGSVRPSS